MKKYIPYISMGALYAAGLAAALLYMNPYTETLTADTIAAETGTESMNEASNEAETETEIEIKVDEVEEASTEKVITPDAESEEIISDDTEIEDEYDENTESDDEYLYYPAVFNNNGRYTKARLNLRSEPSMNGEAIGKCNYGDSLTVLSYVDSQWAYVEYNGEKYYCILNVLEIDDK